jgi:hypothetical protein
MPDGAWIHDLRRTVARRVPRTDDARAVEVGRLRAKLAQLEKNERGLGRARTPSVAAALTATVAERHAIEAALSHKARSPWRKLDAAVARRVDATLAGGARDLAAPLRAYRLAVPSRALADHVLRFPDLYGSDVADRRLARARLAHALRDRAVRELLIPKDDMEDDLSRFDEGGGPLRAAEVVIARMAGCSVSTVQRARTALGHKASGR